MGAVGAWLAAMGLCDLVAGLDGSVASRPRAIAGSMIAVLVAAALGWWMGFPLDAALLLVAITAITSTVWLWSRTPRVWTAKRAVLILASAVTSIVLMLARSGAWPDTADSPAEEWLRAQPFDALGDVTVGFVITILGGVLFLQATANAIVRLLLRVAGTPPSSEQPLRGGRIIGPLERTLIFSLALAGEPTAAALVVSAKGLLRFPEMSREEKSRIHVATEYFLVGSLVSWLLALAAAGLVLLTRA